MVALKYPRHHLLVNIPAVVISHKRVINVFLLNIVVFSLKAYEENIRYEE